MLFDITYSRQLELHIREQNIKIRDRDADYNEKVDLKVYEEVVEKLNQKTKEVEILNDELDSGASRYRWFLNPRSVYYWLVAG